ncbi:lipopolysaccharide biosynthesis protein [Halobellus rarus]|uniref:Lipopolysaccharide biosynthesis protein n=1 Tax=Halobellus rarus TaxID=1126237 RepID=A0ABD6CJ75_9EURY|nr:lipopolysaccharide biosynthesis protein [Halobellus rarus]
MATDNLGDVESRLRKLIHDTSFYSIAVSLSSLLGLVSLLIFTRAFPPASYGRYASSAAIVAIVSTLLFGWLEQAVVRFTPEFENRKVIQNLLSVFTLVSGAFVLVAIGGYLLFGDSLGAYRLFFFPVVALIVAQGFFQPLIMFFRGTLESRSVAKFRTFNAFGRLLISLVLALVVLNHIVGWLWGTALAILGTIALMFITTDELRVVPRIQKDVLRRMMSYGVPMIGFIIGEPFLTQLDRILLEVIRDSASVGIYSSNYTLINQGLRLAYFPVLRAMQPIVVNEWDGDNEDEVGDIISNFSRYFVLLGIPVMVLGMGLGRPLSGLLLDQGYNQGYTIIPFVAGGVFFWGLADAGQRGLELKEATLTLSIGVLLAIGSNFLLNLPMIYYFGYMGAAAATLISSGIYVVFVWYVSSRHINWSFPEHTIRNTVLAGTLMGLPPAAVYLTGSYTHVLVVAASLLGAPIYLTVVYVLGEFREDEIRAVSDLFDTVVGPLR